jgi:uncharacterized protein (TIGR02246 family)
LKESPARADAARTIVKAVNAKDPELYASVFAEDAIVQLYEGPVRLTGREALHENRRDHFARYPQIRCEIQYLAEIGDIVIMHDRVWLEPNTQAPSDVVEIFSFDENGRQSRRHSAERLT